MIKRIGVALHFSRAGNLVARLAEVPPLYINVYTYTLRRVGVLYDVVGNVRSPYGLIRAAERDEGLIGQALYVRQQDLRRRP